MMVLSIPRARFLANAPVGDGSALPPGRFEMAADMARPYGRGFWYGSYRIRAAHHAANPGTRKLMEMDHGRELIAAEFDDRVIGFIRRDALWVHPAHRGRGLGPEMAAELLIEMGCEHWSMQQWTDWLDTPQFTPGGHRNRGKMYDALVRRGIVTPP